MYEIERTSYGMRHTFHGILEPKEMKQWYEDSQRMIQKMTKPFGIVMDMRQVFPFRYETEEILYEAQKLIEKSGMDRTAVISEDPKVMTQVRLVSKYAQVHKKQRFIDSITRKNWEQLSEDWIIEGIDPDRAD